MILDPAAFDQLDDALERLDRIALGTEIERDQIGLAVRQHRDRRRRTAELAARIEFGQRRLHLAVVDVDRDDASRDQSDSSDSLAEHIRMPARRIEEYGGA